MKPSQLLLIFASFVIFYSCQNKSENKEINSGYQLNDSTSVSGLSGDSVKLVKSATINFKVKDVEKSIRDIYALVQKNGGIFQSQHFESNERDRKELKVSDDSLLAIFTTSPQADISLRIPAEHLETLLFELTDLGYFTASSHLQVDDKSLIYLGSMLKQKNRENFLGAHATRKVDSAKSWEAIHVRDESIEHLIANKTINADVAYSMLRLNLFQNASIKKEMIANYIIADYDLPFWERLGKAFNSGWNIFVNLVLAIFHLWIFIILSILFYVIYRYWLQRKKTAFEMK